jgi:type II secretion system protein H
VHSSHKKLLPKSTFTGRTGFTLVELLVVLTLVGLVSATAAVRLSGVTQKARLERSIEILIAADRSLRNYSAKHGRPACLRLNLDAGRVQKVFGKREEGTVSIDLGSGIRLKRLLSSDRSVSSGQAQVVFSCCGTSPTYALEVEGANNTTVYLLIAGLTGQATRLGNDRNVKDALETLRPAGTDAR